VTAHVEQDEEQEQLRLLMRELLLVDEWLSRLGSGPGPMPVAAGAPLAGDDRWSDPFQMSHAVGSALVIAVDHAHCLRRAVEGCVNCAPTELALLLNSYYSLLRGAMENAARAIWLLAPEQRAERVLRRLRLQAGNVIQSDALCEVGAFPRKKPKADRLQRVEEIAQRSSISPAAAVKPPSNREIVRSAGEYIAHNAGHAEVVWRACSAASHGDIWAVLSLHDREESNIVNGVVALRTTASTNVLTTMVVETVAVIKSAFLLRDIRNRPPY
jgi:hypothetical protein